MGDALSERLNAFTRERGLPLQCAQYKGVFTLFATRNPVRNLADAKRADTGRYARLFHAMLDRGYYLPPSQFEIGFISAAHTEEQLTGFAQAVEEAVEEVW